MTTDGDKGKQPKEDRWVCKATEKEVTFDLNHDKETFMEAKNFAKAYILGRHNTTKASLT